MPAGYDAVELARAVRRIRERDVVARGAEHGGVWNRVALEDAGGLAEAERGDVGAEGVQAVGAELDEVGALGPARNGLDPDGAGAREELEHARIREIVAHDVEHGGANVLGRGAHAAILWGDEIAAGVLSGYDSHWAVSSAKCMRTI